MLQIVVQQVLQYSTLISQEVMYDLTELLLQLLHELQLHFLLEIMLQLQMYEQQVLQYLTSEYLKV